MRQTLHRRDWKAYEDRIKGHDRVIRLARTQTSANSEHTLNTGHWSWSALVHTENHSKNPCKLEKSQYCPGKSLHHVLEHKHQNYLVVIDYHSKHIEALRLNGKTSSVMIRCLNKIVSRHGYPQTLIADNMPYNFREMREYAYAILTLTLH